MKNVSNEKKQFITSLCLCVASLVALVFVTVAWFASNKEVSSNGMTVNAEGTSNLVIAATEDAIQTIHLDDSAFSVTFTGAAQLLTAATHDPACSAGLKYNTNPRSVSAQTGLAMSGDLAFADVLTDPLNRTFFVDYVVYIASAGKELESRSLTAELDWTDVGSVQNDGSSVLPDYLKATSIDFYIGEEKTEEYKGTLNLAYQNPENTSVETTHRTIKLHNGNIPIHTTGAIRVTMRVYFDGALKAVQDGAFTGNTYLRTDDINTSNIKLKVVFSAENVGV